MCGKCNHDLIFDSACDKNLGSFFKKFFLQIFDSLDWRIKHIPLKISHVVLTPIFL